MQDFSHPADVPEKGLTLEASPVFQERGPLSPGQEAMWFRNQLSGDHQACIVPSTFRVEAGLELDRLEAALRALVQRHAALRTLFVTTDEGPVQCVLEPAAAASRFQLLRVAMPGSQPDDPTLARQIAELVEQPFRVDRELPFRVCCIELGDGASIIALRVHHLVSDGLSMGILHRELASILGAGGDASELAPTGATLLDAARRQRAQAAGDAWEAQRRYWRDELAGVQDLQIATDRPRPARSDFQAGCVRLEIDAGPVEALRGLARAAGTSRFRAWLALFQVLLARMASQSDFAVGIPGGGRQDPAVRDTVGMFTNTLAIRLPQGTDAMGFNALLHAIDAKVLAAIEHSDCPFESVVADLTTDRSLERNPVYQAYFSFENLPDHWKLALPGLEVSALMLPRLHISLDLSLSIEEHAQGGATATWQYRADLFDEASVERMARRFGVLLRSVVAAPEAPLGDLAWYDEAERRQVLSTWSVNEVDYRINGGVASWLRARADAMPEATALVFGDVSMSYRELDRLSEHWAVRLRGAGVGPEVIVGLGMRRSFGLVVGLLAIVKAGGAFMSLDPDYPAQRLRQMLEDADASVLLSDAGSAQVFAELAPAARVLVVEADGGPVPEGAAQRLTDEAGPEDLAYVIFTSGSTGRPKGAMNLQRGLANDLLWYHRVLGFRPEDRVLQLTSISFDASIWQILATLAFGATVVLPPPGLARDVDALAREIRRSGITLLYLVPSQLRALLTVPGFQAPVPLRYMLCGGEALESELAGQFLQAFPGVGLGNFYGPSEASCDSAWQDVSLPLEPRAIVPIGRPTANVKLYVLDEGGRPLPSGVAGELYVGGVGVGRGYLKRPELTAERFVSDPWSEGGRLYRTGDRVRWLGDGRLEFLGRLDTQVKLRGQRVELGEIEAALRACAGVREAAVVAHGQAQALALVAYVVAPGVGVKAVRDELGAGLPAYMVPQHFVELDALPRLPNGKLDRRALPDPASRRERGSEGFEPARDDAERRLCEAFAQVLELDEVGRNDHFFELGGHSLLVLKTLALLGGEASGIDAAAFFSLPTPAALARRLRGEREPAASDSAALAGGVDAAAPIAIIAVAGRFPGAADVDAFWANLLAGRDGIRHFRDSELDPSLPPELLRDPDYVKARGVLDGVENFDSAFFGIPAREATLMDPQQRVFLELCWQCLERGGYAPDGQRQPVGVFAGMHNATYFRQHVQVHPEQVERLGEFQVMLGNEKDYIATRTANRLNLTGPAVSLNTACSTSLVAIAQAVLALRAGQCAMALAGGSSIHCPPNSGYLYQEGAMLSPDGTTRSFDARGAGTVFSDGAAVVLLKPLQQALDDGDPLLAVIRGVAVNNDGRDKASFTAPSIDGQSAVISAALRDAGVEASDIGYVEAHGTATPLGDPVEVQALTGVLRAGGAQPGSCLLGSVKSNVGHLVIAAGVTGVIKTALALEQERIPASIHYDTPNPHVDFEHSPLKVCSEATAWPRGPRPRLAGVSSFGVGGTNAHVVLQEAPARTPSGPAQGAQLLMLSARSAAALQRMAINLAQHLDDNPKLNLADAAHTLQHGRSAFDHRLCVVASDAGQAAQALRDPAHAWRSQRKAAAPRPVVWMFTGQGSQYPGMGSGLYSRDGDFARAFDAACAALGPHLAFDLKRRMFDGSDDLSATSITQPALFALEYALAQMWLARGLRPAALVGHSVGEFVCAVLAQILSLQDAAALVARRGALMQQQPPGSMLSVRLGAEELQALLPEGIVLAADNGPRASVAAGSGQALDELQRLLEQRGVQARRIPTSHAFHSPLMDGALPGFEAAVSAVRLAPAQLPLVSTCSGDWMSPEQATSPEYWVRQLREPVRFAPALHRALERHPAALFLEVGPRSALCELARQQGSAGMVLAVPSLGGNDPALEAAHVLLAAGALWSAGSGPQVDAANPPQGRRRICLPGYSFEPTRHWVDARSQTASASAAAPAPAPVTPPSLSPAEHSAMSTTAPSLPVAPAASDATAHEALVQRLRRLFEDVAGDDLQQADPAVAFVALGIDSLTLTQAALQLKKEFGVPVSFRQLMQELRSFDALATHLQGLLPQPAQAVAAPAAPQPQVASAAPQPAAPTAPTAATAQSAISGAGGGAVQQLIEQQMRLMAQQLEVLGNLARGGGGPATAAAPAAIPAAVAPAAAAVAPVPSHPTQAAATVASAPADDDTRRYDVKKAFGAIARIHTSQAGSLSERQKARLAAFIRRYVERTARSRDYTTEYRNHLADPRVVNGFRPLTKEITYQIVVERSKGSHLWDLDGNEYVDVLSGFGMSLFGWQPDFVLEAVRKQLDAGYDIGPQHPLAGPVGDLVCELTGFDRAGLCNTGSEAVMAALRIARTVTGRDTVVLFTGSYHGTFDEVVVRAGRAAKGIPGAPGIMRGMFGDVRVLDYGTPESLAFIREHAGELAAVLVEPVQSRRPEFRPVDFLKDVRAVTEQNGCCLIFDEVITGFRSALGGTQELFGIRADLATYGKVIGGGMPIGVVAGKRAYMDALDGGAWQYGDDSIPIAGVTYFAGTFVRHPLALAAAHASLLHLKERGPALQQELNARTTALAEELSAFCREVGAPLEVRHFSSLWRVSWLEDHPLQDLLFAMMRSRGVHILDNFPCFLTTSHTEADIRLVAEAFKESVRELQESEFLPRRKSPVAVVFDASKPPVPGARLGKDASGKPAWFVPHPDNPSKYMKVSA